MEHLKEYETPETFSYDALTVEDNETTNIDTDKAIRFNKKYEKELWGNQKALIIKYFVLKNFLKDSGGHTPADFALAVAQWQSSVFKKGKNIDGALGPVSWSVLMSQIMAAQVTAPVGAPSRWHNLISGAVACPADFLVNGKETFTQMVQAIRTADGPGHYIYILGWMLDIDFELIPGDSTTTLYFLLKQATNKGAEVRVMIWNNLYYQDEINLAQKYINALPHSSMVKDNVTYGSPYLKAAISFFRKEVNSANLQFPILNLSDKWKGLVKDINTLQNEGSHHEKILVVKGSEGLVAFCGGIDINPDRREGSRRRWLPENQKPYQIDEFKLLDSGCFGSDVLHDVHCKLKGHAAWTLLQRFIQRWKVYFTVKGPVIPPLRGMTESIVSSQGLVHQCLM